MDSFNRSLSSLRSFLENYSVAGSASNSAHSDANRTSLHANNGRYHFSNQSNDDDDCYFSTSTTASSIQQQTATTIGSDESSIDSPYDEEAALERSILKIIKNSKIGNSKILENEGRNEPDEIATNPITTNKGSCSNGPSSPDMSSDYGVDHTTMNPTNNAHRYRPVSRVTLPTTPPRSPYAFMGIHIPGVTSLKKKSNDVMEDEQISKRQRMSPQSIRSQRSTNVDSENHLSIWAKTPSRKEFPVDAFGNSIFPSSWKLMNEPNNDISSLGSQILANGKSDNRIEVSSSQSYHCQQNHHASCSTANNEDTPPLPSFHPTYEKYTNVIQKVSPTTNTKKVGNSTEFLRASSSPAVCGNCVQSKSSASVASASLTGLGKFLSSTADATDTKNEVSSVVAIKGDKLHQPLGTMAELNLGHRGSITCKQQSIAETLGIFKIEGSDNSCNDLLKRQLIHGVCNGNNLSEPRQEEEEYADSDYYPNEREVKDRKKTSSKLQSPIGNFNFQKNKDPIQHDGNNNLLSVEKVDFYFSEDQTANIPPPVGNAISVVERKLKQTKPLSKSSQGLIGTTGATKKSSGTVVKNKTSNKRSSTKSTPTDQKLRKDKHKKIKAPKKGQHFYLFGHGRLWTTLALIFALGGTVCSIVSRWSTSFVALRKPLEISPLYQDVTEIGMIWVNLCYNETVVPTIDANVTIPACSRIRLSTDYIDDRLFEVSRSFLSLGSWIGSFLFVLLATSICWVTINLKPIGFGFLVAYFFQSFALLFFDSDLCDRAGCRMTSGGIFCIIASLCWIVTCVATAKMDAYKIRARRRQERREHLRLVKMESERLREQEMLDAKSNKCTEPSESSSIEQDSDNENEAIAKKQSGKNIDNGAETAVMNASFPLGCECCA